MAEIKIEKKKPIWPWILGLIVLGLIIYLLAFAGDDDMIDDAEDDLVEEVSDDMDDNTDDMDDTYDLTNINSITALNNYIANPEMGLDHVYSHGALSKLINATRDVANAVDIDLNADLNAANEMADHITKNPLDVDHADKIKNAASIITRALEKIQTTRYPALSNQLTKVKAAVDGIKPGTETLEQKKSVKAFFNEAAALLTSMK